MNAAANNPASIQRVLQLSFLGGFSASIDGVPLTDLPYDKVRALLAYLVMEPVEHSRESLAELLWPDLDGEKARGNLRRCLFDLRRALGDSAAAPSHDFIVGGMRTLRFNFAAPYRLDVDEFIAADYSIAQKQSSVREQRTTLYRGPLLAGLSLPDAPEFDVWIIAKREALHRSALAQLEQSIAYCEQHNEASKALECAQRAIEIDCWRESLQRAYLRLLARNSQAAALAHFDHFCRALSEDLGVSPEQETLALVERIRRGELTVAVAPAPVAGRAERRRLVALVCDIELREHADPEEATARLAAPLAACAAMIGARRGYVASSLGGELLVFFGYPAARESAPRDAADAALALAEYLCGEDGLMFRIGLHAGWCYASASGDTPDETGLLFKSARRLALDAPEGRIAVSAELRRIIGGYFRFEPGAGSGNDAVFLSGKSHVSRRIDLYGNSMPTLVGRQSELAQLSILWGDVRMGKRRSVLLRAEPGIGKSRLAAAIAQQVALSGSKVCEIACQPEAAHTPYYPLLQGLLREMGDDENEVAEVRRQKVANFLKKLRLDADVAWPILAQLLGIPRNEAAPNETSPSPAERKQKEDSLLAELFGRLGRGKPLLLIVEDIHWADQSTLAFLARALDGDGAPGMLLLTSRHAPPQAIAARLAVEIALTPLAAEATRALVVGLLGEQKISEPVLAAIVSRADGVPLYAEELARSMQTAPEDIPATLWDILAARLDNLGAAKRIAQQAAAVGREFSTELLQTIGANNQHLAEGLDAMLRAGLVQSFPAGQYRFRHSLIRDAAYQSITLAERRLIHRDVATALRSHFAEQVATHPEMLARHLSAAGDPAAAAVWLEAGTYAAAHSANSEAIHDFNAGLDILKLLPEDDAYRIRNELQLQVALGIVLIAAEGYGSETAKLCFVRAWTLSEQASEDRDLFPVMWGLWQSGRNGDDGLPPLELAHRLARMAGNSPDPVVRIAVDYAYGNNYYWVGEFDLARQHLESAIRLADKVLGALQIARYGEDVGISSRAFLSWVCWIQGDPDGARRMTEENIALARQLDHAHSLGYAMSFAAVLYRLLRQPEQTAAISRELLAHTDKHGLLLWQAVAAAHLGWALAATGDAAGLEPIRQGVAGARIAMPSVVSTFLSILADALAQLRRPAEVLEVIAEARHEIDKIQDIYYVPELMRLQGEAMLQLAPACVAEANKLFAQALKQAEASGAHQLALRCATSLARQHLAAGQKAKAKKLLTQALSRVHGDPSNPDIHDANQLLDQLV